MFAEESDRYYTDNHINGRFWKTMEFTEKLYYLYGMVDGVTIISDAKPIFDEANNIKPSVSTMILSQTGRFFIPRGSYKEIVKFIDKYYSKKSNLDKPVYLGYIDYLAEQKEWSALSSWSERMKNSLGR